jgi:hypothetical protein
MDGQEKVDGGPSMSAPELRESNLELGLCGLNAQQLSRILLMNPARSARAETS